jgi:hypothetical protein
MKTTRILTTIAVGSCWTGAVPSNSNIFSGPADIRRTHLVGTDKIRENRPERRMRVSNDIIFGTSHDLFRDSVTDVAGFAKIIPYQCRTGCQHHETRCFGNARHTSYNLDKIRHDLQNLLPSIEPQRLAGAMPVFIPLWEV